MNIIWNPVGFGMDQTIIMGDTDYFYLSKEEAAFTNGEASFEDQEVYGEVMKIVHPELGKVLGVLTQELSYRIFLNDGSYIQIDAEENIGKVEYSAECKIDDWNFKVELNVQYTTGFSSMERMNLMTEKGQLGVHTERNEKDHRLLSFKRT